MVILDNTGISEYLWIRISRGQPVNRANKLTADIHREYRTPLETAGDKKRAEKNSEYYRMEHMADGRTDRLHALRNTE